MKEYVLVKKDIYGSDDYHQQDIRLVDVEE